MTLRQGNATTALFVGLVLLGAYVFYTSFKFAADSQSTMMHRMALWTGVFALGPLFVMNKLRWRPWVQGAVVGILCVALLLAYSFIWEQTPLAGILVLTVLTNMFTFLAAWALWHHVIRRWSWLAAIVVAALCLLILVLPAVRSNLALIVIAVLILPGNRSVEGRTGPAHAG